MKTSLLRHHRCAATAWLSLDRRWRLRYESFCRRLNLILRVALVCLLINQVQSASCDVGALAWRITPESLALERGGEVVWELSHGDQADAPYFHPVATTSGAVLTCNEPPDHPWHHGLWFGWKYINGVNYWEHNPRHGRPDGRTLWTLRSIDTRDDFSAAIELDLEYAPRDGGTKVLREQRRLDVAPPQADGSYAIDWSSEFVAVERVVLDRTPPQSGSYGGYAGLSIRFSSGLQDRRAIDSDGEIAFDQGGRYRGRAVAIDYSGQIDDRIGGVAVIEHPSNPRRPTPWYLIDTPEIGFLNAALLNDQPLQLERGDELNLKYRVVVHSGRWGLARLRSEVDGYERSAISDTHHR